MSNDDSFNDCDEIFNIYSSKKVTDTFKAQLKKIAAHNHISNNVLKVNDKGVSGRKNVGSSEVHPVEEQRDVEVILVNERIQTLGNKAPNPVVDVSDDNLEDSIEVISEFTPRAIRRSNRLRKKRGQTNCEVNPPSNITSDNKRTPRGRKGKKRSKLRKGKQFEEVTLEGSPQLTEQDDELNPEVSVKVIWKSVNIKKFQMRKFQKLSCIFEQLSKEENIPEDKIILMFNNVRVNRSDTPDSLNLQVYHFLDGGVLSELSNACQTPKSHKSKCDNDSVTLKFQDINKKVIKLDLNKKDKLKVGMIKCSEQLEVPLNKMKFYLDGEVLDPFETPETLDLENEEVIDIKIF